MRRPTRTVSGRPARHARRRLGRRRPPRRYPLCFVVTHHAPERSHPSIYTFVTDGVATAIEQGKQTAGDKKVSLFGATVMQQALPLGLVDEIRVHVIPVLLGGGTLLFAALDSTISLERTQVVATPAATHLGFRVVQ
ncbi:MAG: dihydrofolate reductase family protein [Solirubrobacterales bacterium]|nr:dihydrofolate reductase family protein [Solirubrobacterales bacterium]